MKKIAAAALAASALLFSSSAVSAQTSDEALLVAVSPPPPAVIVEESAVPDTPPLPPPPPLHPCALVDCAAAVRYMRALPPDVLIDLVFEGTGAAPTMKRIALRESGLGRRAAVPFDAACSAANPRSSASGLFQTLSLHRPRAERLGLSWSNVTGRDCLDDVLLARAIWNDSGLRPWRTA